MSFVTIQNGLFHWAPYLAASAVVLAVAALVILVILERRIARLTGGRKASIEEVLAILNREMKELQVFRAELEKYLKLAEARLRGAVQGVGVVRFNPFRDGQGGNQSFAVALVDERGSGVVFSTLYTRERVGVYAKPLTEGASSFELSDEEKEAITKARQSAAQHKKI
jgi:hypothetical protein